ncbi:hypothetical protein EAG_06383 [Camponotus floridanus]|uniref:Uncharacterized protein n=2 Tax=Camponotus floridanus TaxID=104421 RepID=E2ADI2_CAMFO|nr:hypothetical protein EAG_06383 [Camponotus floridanus]
MKNKKETKSEPNKAIKFIDAPENSPSGSAKMHSSETMVSKTDTNDSKSSTWVVPKTTETAGPSYMHPSDVPPNNSQTVKNYGVLDRCKEAQNYPSALIGSAQQTQMPSTFSNIVQNDVYYAPEDKGYAYQQPINYGVFQSQQNNNYCQWNNCPQAQKSIDLQNANSYAPKLNSCAPKDNTNCLLNQNKLLSFQNVYNDLYNSENYLQL